MKTVNKNNELYQSTIQFYNRYNKKKYHNNIMIKPNSPSIDNDNGVMKG